ncbi:MAG: tRNA lysidine(34) synthetase TilS, partial [Nitrosomonas sp.]|nr:tRNA lysidine(34) synthetase TilS [Nitrosomonas sp.]
MAHSRKSKSNSLLDHLEETLHAHVKPNDHLIVALSGGIDSIVLLDALASYSKPMRFSLSATHVNHGISENASYWSEFCSQLCSTINIPISVTQLNVKSAPGQSLEAAARDARYRVFNHLAANYIVLAQHKDDQAETLFLQLLRGAGVKGLAAMPVIRKQTSNTAPQILRPLLQVSRREIENYAKQNQLSWIEDESNENTRFNRNFLRHEIFPQLEKRYPSYKTTFLRASRHLAEASALLDELAMLDQKNCSQAKKIQIDRLARLSLPRA